MLFDKFLGREGCRLSTYAFANIYIWKGLFRIFWAIVENNLCILFQDKIGAFFYLPPLGKRQTADLIARCFAIMDGFNLNAEISRIENVQAEDLELYQSLGYECVSKGCDYVYRSDSLIGLKGNAFKSQRAGLNYFLKHYACDYQPFSLKDKKDCLALCRDWMDNRRRKSSDPVYRQMLQDSLTAQKQAMDNYRELRLIGRVVKINRQIKGYTFGFPLNKETFCVLFEITDLNCKGISQFIFHRLIQESRECRYVNVMDDSGLENLRRVKLSYRPVKLIPAYIVKRKPRCLKTSRK